MALPSIAGVVRCSIQGTTATGQPWVNVVHAQYSGGASEPGLTEVTALDGKLIRLWTGTAYGTGIPWMTVCSTDVKLVNSTYYVLDNATGAMGFNHAASGSLPTNTSLPGEVAHVVTLRTPNRGRRYRGRLYLPGVSTSNATGGVLSATVAANFLTQLNGLQADLATIQWVLGVASYGVSWVRGPHNAHGAATKVTWTPFFTAMASPTGATMDLKPDVQRRRK